MRSRVARWMRRRREWMGEKQEEQGMPRERPSRTYQIFPLRTCLRRHAPISLTCPYRCSSLRFAPSVEASGELRRRSPRGLGVPGLGVSGVRTDMSSLWGGVHGAV